MDGLDVLQEMKILHFPIFFSFLCFLTLALHAEAPIKTNAYHLTFKDDNGVALAEAKFITPEFRSKEHGALKVRAEIRLLDNTSTTKSAEWLKRLLNTGKEVEIEIRTTSYKSIGGIVIATTGIEFNPNVADANISATYPHPPQTEERSWSYGIYSGGFKGGSVTFNRIQLAEQAGTGQPATRPELKSEGSDKPQPESEGRSR